MFWRVGIILQFPYVQKIKIRLNYHFENIPIFVLKISIGYYLLLITIFEINVLVNLFRNLFTGTAPFWFSTTKKVSKISKDRAANRKQVNRVRFWELSRAPDPASELAGFVDARRRVRRRRRDGNAILRRPLFNRSPISHS